MQLLQTKDQSHTLYIPELDETYHSRNGAVEEALYVYIGRGLKDKVNSEESAVRSPQSTVEKSSGKNSTSTLNQNTHDEIPVRQGSADRAPDSYRKPTEDNPLVLLEVGFGTGLNAWLTALECVSLNVHCLYHSLETFPLSFDIISQLNYTSQASQNDAQLFRLLHEVTWNAPAMISDFFELTKLEQSLISFIPTQQYDIIYFDAFAPDKQPELWTEAMFQKLYDCLNPAGMIVTYSSKGDIKRLWKQIGFEVERLPGPPMKRHMLRGRKKVGNEEK